MNSPRDFELVAVTIQVDGRPDIPVPLPPESPGDPDGELPQVAPLTLRAGTEFRTRLAFTVRSKHDIEGLRYIDERSRQGVTMTHRETLLGDYRSGGPYEIVLPAEHLPTGHLARDVYEVTGTFVDKEGKELGRETHHFEIIKDWPH
ncbi:hypothetical protein [Streptomyces sp. NPDC002133]|uniref:hypothetical protein n=1 Tax=Streptomyces sp. NPDC002133 TaxID=3154409 RepID=UPI00332F0B72